MSFNSISINAPPSWFHCEPAWHWAPQPLTDFDLWFVASGRGHLRLEGHDHELRSGACFVLSPGARPLGGHDPRHPLVVFACHFSVQNARTNEIWPHARVVRDTSFFIASAQRAEKLWRRGDESGREMARFCIENLLRQLQDEAHQPWPSPLDESLETLVERIRAQPSQTWRLNEMASAVHLSRAAFVRHFRARFGQAPAHFVIEVRLERARQLLLETGLDLEGIARALGYANVGFFARQFKQRCGQTPGQWRRGARAAATLRPTEVKSSS